MPTWIGIWILTYLLWIDVFWHHLLAAASFAFLHSSLYLTKHSLGVFPSTPSAIYIHLSLVATVDGISLIFVSICFCYISVHSSGFWAGTGWEACLALDFSAIRSYFICSWASFFILASFSFSFCSMSLFSSTIFCCNSWSSFALAMTSFWDLLPTKSAMTLHLLTVPAGNLTIPFVRFWVSSEVQSLLLATLACWASRAALASFSFWTSYSFT